MERNYIKEQNNLIAVCEESEKKIQSIMLKFDRLQEKTYLHSGFQAFFFWASPVLMLVQTILLVVAIWGKV